MAKDTHRATRLLATSDWLGLTLSPPDPPIVRESQRKSRTLLGERSHGPIERLQTGTRHPDSAGCGGLCGSTHRARPWLKQRSVPAPLVQTRVALAQGRLSSRSTPGGSTNMSHPRPAPSASNKPRSALCQSGSLLSLGWTAVMPAENQACAKVAGLEKLCADGAYGPVARGGRQGLRRAGQAMGGRTHSCVERACAPPHGTPRSLGLGSTRMGIVYTLSGRRARHRRDPRRWRVHLRSRVSPARHRAHRGAH